LAALLCGCGQRSAESETEENTDAQPSEAVTSLSCCDGATTLRFHRDEVGAWVWTDDTSFPLDGQYADRLAAAALELEQAQALTAPDHPETYGVYTSGKYLTLQRVDGEEVTYYFGDQADSGEYYFCSASDESRICLAPQRMLELMGRSVYDMALLPELPAIESDSVRIVVITTGDQTDRMTVSRGRWLRGDEDVTDAESTRQLIALLADPTLLRCVDYAPAAGAALVCGLTAPTAVLRVEYANRVGADAEFVLTVGDYLAIERGCYVTINDDPTIYLMDAGPLAVLRNWGR
jgi:hypothetical protein